MNAKVEQTELFKELADKCKKGQSGPVNPIALQGMVIAATTELGNLLNRACTNFPDYTLHDEEHALRVIFLMHRLMPPETLVKLSVIDLALLILSAYGHDIGMAVGREARKKIRDSDSYKTFLLEYEVQWQEAEKARQANNENLHEFLSSQLFQTYLRKQHHFLSAKTLKESLKHLFLVDDKNLVEPVALLSISHGEPIEYVSKMRSFPFAGQFNSDLPFLACVLRLADYLDLDPARAPESLLNLIKPETEISRREWRKHQANSFFIDAQTIRFQAQFTDFFEEKALRDTLKGIDVERRECMEFLRSRKSHDLMLTLSAKLDCDIQSSDYIYEEFKFTLEYKEILSLLMGTRLYGDERAFIRELIQNSLDACRSAEAANVKAGRPNYPGRITITRKLVGSQEVIEVSDTGSGMTRSIISDYFMRAGRSYYRSFAFRRKDLDIHPVSQFGIGILSCFMVSNYLEVETSPDALVHSDAKSEELKALKLEIRGPSEYFVVRMLENSRPGTTVRLFLKEPLTGSLQSIVARFLGRCPYPIEIKDHEKLPLELPKEPFDFSNEIYSDLFVAMPGSFGYVSKDLVFEGKFGFAVHGRIRFYLLEADNRRFLQRANVGKYSFVGFGPTGETLVNLKQLTSEVQQSTNSILLQIRGLMAHLPMSCRPNIESILRSFEENMETLRRQHTSQHVEIIWGALTSQVDALKVTTTFNFNPVSVKITQLIEQAIMQIESFVRGQIKMSAPTGLLTQDGIRLSSFFHLENHLKLGLGYLFNLDLCGEFRVSLNAARDNVVHDEKLEQVILYLYKKIGEFLGSWFKAENILQNELDLYLSNIPKALAETIIQSFKSK